jgi:Raf kinase inhibitor-like YbhB/YbcL family protein
MTLTISSPDFVNNKPIPAVYTCNGAGISPALVWNEPPAGTRSFAIIMDDPDAPGGTWVHWVLYNIPATLRGLAQAASSDARLPDGSVNGKNSWGRLGYGGPCPPGGTHHYYFKLYALDTTLDLAANAGKQQLLSAMQGHVLAEGELIGTVSK